MSEPASVAAHPGAGEAMPALFISHGAASDPTEQVIDGFWMGLAKRSVQVR